MSERKEKSLLFVGSFTLIGVLFGGGTVAGISFIEGGKRGGTDTPLRVRGGSMTVFTNVAGGWRDLNGHAPNDLPYCVEITDTSHIEMDGFIDNNEDPADEEVKPDAKHWTMTVRSHNADDFAQKEGDPHVGDDPSDDGLIFEARGFGCDGHDTTLQSIKISVFDNIGGGNVGKYAIALPNKQATKATPNPRTASFRFLDRSLGDSDPDGKSGREDQEYQERMSDMKLEYKENGNQKTMMLFCPDGDCSIGIGKAQ